MLHTVRPWESLSDDEKRLFTRMADVFAGYVSNSDDQLGRVIDFLEQSGELDTIIVAPSDNWASGQVSGRGEFHPPALVEPGVRVSPHLAPTGRTQACPTRCQCANRDGLRRLTAFTQSQAR